MIGFIKNLINGIVNFITGLFGKKKNGGYYLEFDEAAEATKQAAKQAASKAKEAAESVVSKAQEVVEPVVSKAQEVVEPAASKAQQAVKPAASKAKKAAKSVATQAADNNGTKDAATATKSKPAKVELVQTASGVKPEPAKPEKAKAVIQQQPAESTFAPKYLAVPNSTNGRRRPGANMTSFLDMARQVKTSK
ncbi:hypothetical protein [Brasilonema sp. UFV-L1]|uniref:hypothetical protein n=1 Tax=Brasilonema sp. UFV-L1 TaxID=2234130 RepID=UPI00145E5822|nr:hypothetical protein [Brasilonema sp. UFV-L1]NMG06477.1 hypothetical protein [Brasilonema sp. UFV-L1]